MTQERSQVGEATRRAEENEAAAPHVADRPATAEEAAQVEGRVVDPAVRRHHQEMTERGAQEAGEGRVP